MTLLEPVEKVCPVVLRRVKGEVEILAFRHPAAGLQLVKGSLEAGEGILHGALRELEEESGLCGVAGSGAAGGGSGWTSDAVAVDQRWHFVPVTIDAAPDQFSFVTRDDGGWEFSFFWWPLRARPDGDWHPIFVRALGEIRSQML